MKKQKYIFITGGVISSLGKGLSAASIATLLESRGLSVTLIKMDPYINVDPGTMNPFQHGEVFVLEDGAETDLDLGHYERFTNVFLSKKNNFTAGQIYNTVIQNERRGDYLGETVQVIPHITDEIKNYIYQAADGSEIAIIEVGGTVGDIESLSFIEAIRQMKYDIGDENLVYIHLTLLPFMKTAGELKTKPTQHSVRQLRSEGIDTDILLCRCHQTLSKEIKKKISLFCNLHQEEVFSAIDVDSIYELPLYFMKEGLDEKILEHLGIWATKPNMKEWEKMIERVKNPVHHILIGIVGKYVDLKESYKSLEEALMHGGISHNARVELVHIDAEELEAKKKEALEKLENVDAILIPGGFGNRGIEGKIAAITFARENDRPFFGICLGMQLAVVEYARNVLGWKDAHTAECTKNSLHLVINYMENQEKVLQMGASMRLGAYDCEIQKGTKAHKAYACLKVRERHRHRFEVSNSFRQALSDGGLLLSGLCHEKRTGAKDGLVEIIEISSQSYFLACQFHPEFKSKPLNPHPLFRSFIEASLKYRQEKK